MSLGEDDGALVWRMRSGRDRFTGRFTLEGALVWRMRSGRDRFTGRFTLEGDAITGHWERLTTDGDRVSWTDIMLTRRADT